MAFELLALSRDTAAEEEEDAAAVGEAIDSEGLLKEGLCADTVAAKPGAEGEDEEEAEEDEFVQIAEDAAFTDSADKAVFLREFISVFFLS